MPTHAPIVKLAVVSTLIGSAAAVPAGNVETQATLTPYQQRIQNENQDVPLPAEFILQKACISNCNVYGPYCMHPQQGGPDGPVPDGSRIVQWNECGPPSRTNLYMRPLDAGPNSAGGRNYVLQNAGSPDKCVHPYNGSPGPNVDLTYWTGCSLTETRLQVRPRYVCHPPNCPVSYFLLQSVQDPNLCAEVQPYPGMLSYQNGARLRWSAGGCGMGMLSNMQYWFSAVPAASSPSTPPALPPPSPMLPPAAPALTYDPATTTPGWCANWQMGIMASVGDRDYYHNHTLHSRLWERDMGSCFALCSNHAACNQAVFETATGPWGPQCWLGVNTMTTLPAPNFVPGRPGCVGVRGNTAGCTDFCFFKGGIPASLRPASEAELGDVQEAIDPAKMMKTSAK